MPAVTLETSAVPTSTAPRLVDCVTAGWGMIDPTNEFRQRACKLRMSKLQSVPN